MKMKDSVQYLNVIVKENLTFVHSSFMIFFFLIVFEPTAFSLIKIEFEEGVYVSWNVIVKKI